MGVPMVSTSGGLFGDLFKDLMFHFKQNMNSFHKKNLQGAHLGLVNSLKINDVQLVWNSNLGKIQIVAKWKIHTSPPCVQGQNGVLGTHPREMGWVPLVHYIQ